MHTSLVTQECFRSIFCYLTPGNHSADAVEKSVNADQVWVVCIWLNAMSASEKVSPRWVRVAYKHLKLYIRWKNFAILGMALPWISLCLMRMFDWALPARDTLIWIMQSRVERASFCSRGKLLNILEADIRICDSIWFSPEGKYGILFLWDNSFGCFLVVYSH